MRRLFLLLLILLALTFAACSYSVEFVVVNESNAPIEVRCRIINFLDDSDPVTLIGPLSTANASQLRAGDGAWRELSNTEYRTARETRTVSVRVMPGEALLVKSFHDTAIQNGEPTYFTIEEITLAGAAGEIRLQGRQVAKAFVAESNRLYVLAYK